MGWGPRRLTREEGKRRTRGLLLDAAEEVFARRGFDGASVEDVAEEAGFSKGAVYSNFGGKDDLFLALLDRRLERGGPDWERIFSGRASSEERLRAVERQLLEGAEDLSWTMLEMEFFLYAMREEGARRKLAERYRRIREGIAGAVGRHFEEGDVEPLMSMEELSWVLLGVATGLDLQSYVDPQAVPRNLRSAALRPLLAGPAPKGGGR
ncbi:MAG: TetR/AcrR family transcriptional regulator [Rubrobacter sp.]